MLTEYLEDRLEIAHYSLDPHQYDDDDTPDVMLALERDRAAWWRVRRSGIGGSEIAAILGVDPYRSPIDVWQSKVLEDDAIGNDNARTRGGHRAERWVAGDFARGAPRWSRTGGPLITLRAPTFRRRDRPWHLFTPDRLCWDPDRLTMIGAEPAAVRRLGGRDYSDAQMLVGQAMLLKIGIHAERMLTWKPDSVAEIKSHGWFGGKEYPPQPDDRIGDTHFDGAVNYIVDLPDAKRLQLAWSQEGLEVDSGYLLALIDTHFDHTWALPRDPQLGADMLEVADRWWRTYVVPRVEPPPDGSESFTRYLKERFKKNKGQILRGSRETDEIAAALKQVRRVAKKAELQEELLEQKLKLAIGDADGIQTIEGDITWKYQRSGKLKEKEARAVLYKRAGMTDDEITAFEAEHELPGFRALRPPQNWTKDIKL